MRTLCIVWYHVATWASIRKNLREFEVPETAQFHEVSFRRRCPRNQRDRTNKGEEERFGVPDEDAAVLGALLLSSPEGVELFLVGFEIAGDEGTGRPCVFTGEGDGKMSFE